MITQILLSGFIVVFSMAAGSLLSCAAPDEGTLVTYHPGRQQGAAVCLFLAGVCFLALKYSNP